MNYGKPHFHLFILTLLSCLSLNVSASLSTENGDLQSYLSAIEFGSENDGVFKIPGTQQLTDFESVVSLIMQAEYDQASVLAASVAYELVAYTDTITAKLFYVLREINPYPSAQANGGGIYVFQPLATYNVAIHAPHPRFDTNTNRSAISAFFASNARYFLMAGSHRRSHPDPSSCQNFSDYRPSDAIHNTAHFFYAAHKAMEDFDKSIHYMELHGFSSDSLAVIASQCDTGGNENVVNLSETLSDDQVDDFSLMHTLESVIDTSSEIKACIYSTILDAGPDDKYTQYLGGSTNTTARYTNGSPSVCDQGALTADNSRRYIHIEQSRGIRLSAQNRELMASYIQQAIHDYFEGVGKPFAINAGLNDAWYDPVTDGQGFFITVFPDLGYVSLAWFTYDTQLPPDDAVSYLGDAGHRWLVALGPIDGAKSEMNISVSSGGLFDMATEVTEVIDGTIILTFEGCNSGTVEYDIPSINQQGTVPIQRVAGDNIVLCEALK